MEGSEEDTSVLEFDSGNVSVVDILGEYTSSCGYCREGSGSVSYGIISKRLQPDDYQNLMDRGWRRCGFMCYKPLMNRTCCPQYTIRCYTPEFQLSKSQKKVLRKMTTFLRSGSRTEDKKAPDSNPDAGSSSAALHKALKDLVQRKKDGARQMGVTEVKTVRKEKLENMEELHTDTKKGTTNKNADSKSLKSGSRERDASRISVTTGASLVTLPDNQDSFPRKKAKVVRLENKMNKLRQKGLKLTIDHASKLQLGKSLEEHLAVDKSVEGTHNLDVKLVLTSSLSEEQCKEEWELYRKYQMTVHRDSEEECGYEEFVEFLVSSPLQQCSPEGSPTFCYGSFHQQHRLNGKLIGVGVLDILPLCVSSVYFFYDPDYSQLSLGTYGALREIAFTRSLTAIIPQLQYYYLGYYVHSCEKMRYKKNYSPSFLLCPELFTWHPVDKCLPKIDANKYCRLDDSTTNLDEKIDYNKVSCWVSFLQKLMPFQSYQSVSHSLTALFASLAVDAKEEIDEYAHYVGQKCAESMIVVI